MPFAVLLPVQSLHAPGTTAAATDLEEAQEAATDLEEAQEAATDLEEVQEAAMDLEEVQEAAMDPEEVQEAAMDPEEVQEAVMDLEEAQEVHHPHLCLHLSNKQSTTSVALEMQFKPSHSSLVALQRWRKRQRL